MALPKTSILRDFEIVTQKNTKMHTKYGKVWGNDKTLRETCIINVFEFHRYQKAKTYEQHSI